MAKATLVAEPNSHKVELIREVDAPPELVFRTFVEPELLGRWWGQDSATTIVSKLEARPGGLWRFVQREADGTEYAFHGVFHEVSAPRRLVYTFEFEGMPGHVLMQTITLENVNGKTRISDASVFQTVEDRDGMIESGMEGGANESYGRLDRLLKTL